MVILVSAVLRCQPSSVSADWVTSATGQWFGRGHPMAQAENRNCNRAYTKNFDHEQPRYAGHRADTRGRC